ncbi:MAG: hypothetical protein JEZ14_24830 [Marinilabiliaceae bacterium]|nr:hypothetical protein [Marinilabiliaceae bacterium]
MKEFLIILSASWKFAATFPVAVLVFDLSFFETLLYTNIGGLMGIIIAAMASKGIIHFSNILFPVKIFRKRKKKRIFTRKSRRIIKIKVRYGLPGIILLTHVLLSIPVGVFLLTRYFGRKNINYLYLVFAQLVWSLVFTFFYVKLFIFIHGGV